MHTAKFGAILRICCSGTGSNQGGIKIREWAGGASRSGNGEGGHPAQEMVRYYNRHTIMDIFY